MKLLTFSLLSISFASATAFGYSQNDLFSYSPAQYAAKGSSAEGMLNYHATKVENSDYNGLDLGGLYQKRLNRASTFGLELRRNQFDSDNVEVSQLLLVPGANFKISPQIILGGALMIGQTTIEVGNSDDTENIMLPRLGALFTSKKLGLGVSFNPEDDDARIASNLTIHGYSSLGKGKKVGASVQLLSLDSADAMKVEGGGEFGPGRTAFVAGLGILSGDSVSLEGPIMSDGTSFEVKGGVSHRVSAGRLGLILTIGNFSGENDLDGTFYGVKGSFSAAL